MEEKSNKRYPGIRPFQDTEIDQILFRGRKYETQQLLHLILAEKLIVLFAKSGVGKSSLLNAGIFNSLREKGYFPTRIRLNDPKLDFIDAVDLHVRNDLAKAGIEYTEGEKQSLWQYFKTAEFWSTDDTLLTPVIVFDQFEELFTLGYSDEQRKLFFEQLADLVSGSIPESLMESIDQTDTEKLKYLEMAPNIKVVISIREDFLAQLEEMAVDIPSILSNRFRLKALNEEQALEAIEEPAELMNENLATKKFKYDKKAINTILQFLMKTDSQTSNTFDVSRKFWPWKFLGIPIIILLISVPIIAANEPFLVNIYYIINLLLIFISCIIFAYKKPIKPASAGITTLLLSLTFLLYIIIMQAFVGRPIFTAEPWLTLISFFVITLVFSTLTAYISYIQLKRIGKAKTKTGIATAKEIEPFQLQLICEHIEDKVLKKQISTASHDKDIIVTEHDFGGQNGMNQILQSFYSNQIKRVQRRYRKHVQKLCEKGLISPTGRRLSLAEEIVTYTYKIPIQILRSLIDYRLLRAEPKLNTYYYELSHDTMVRPIFETAQKRSRKKTTWLSLIIGFPIFMFTVSTLVTFQQEKKNLQFDAAFNERCDSLDQLFRLNNNLLEDDKATIYNKIEGLRNNNIKAGVILKSADSLVLEHPNISAIVNYKTRINTLHRLNEYFNDTLISLQDFSLTSTQREKEELRIKNTFDAAYSYLIKISKNSDDLINNDQFTLNEKIDGLQQYKSSAATRIDLLEYLVHTYPMTAEKYKFGNLLSDVKRRYDGYIDKLNQLQRISNSYANIKNPDDFVFCRNVNKETLEPEGISTEFSSTSNIYVRIRVICPRTERLSLKWKQSGREFSNLYNSQLYSRDYPDNVIIYYCKLDLYGYRFGKDEPRSGGITNRYEVRLYNSQNYLIARRFFQIIIPIQQQLK